MMRLGASFLFRGFCSFFPFPFVMAVGVSTVVTGIVGCAGLLPTVAAIKAGKNIALANKETLIAAGPVILPLVEKHQTILTPADSEHSAIFQCIQGSPERSLRRILLTASGGAFRNWKAEDLVKVTLEDALKHGLEVIEAHYLFGVDYDNIDVIVHPESIIHSMVEFADTSVIGQLGRADMRLPLLYALSWPHRLRMSYPSLDLIKLRSLHFEAPDTNKYPSLNLAYAAGRAGGTMPAVLNAANEQAIEMFREGRIHFLEIPRIVEFVMEKHKAEYKTENVNLEDILKFDLWSRRAAEEYSPDLSLTSKIDASILATAA